MKHQLLFKLALEVKAWPLSLWPWENTGWCSALKLSPSAPRGDVVLSLMDPSQEVRADPLSWLTAEFLCYSLEREVWGLDERQQRSYHGSFKFCQGIVDKGKKLLFYFPCGKTHWRSSNSFTKMDSEVCFHCLAPSHLSCLEHHLGLPVGGGLYSNCIPGSSRSTRMSFKEGRFDSLQPRAAVGVCDTLWLAKKPTPACNLLPLALHPFQSPWLTCLLAAQQRFFHLANVTALVMARVT